MALFRVAFFRLFALVFRHFAWPISFFLLFAWRYFVFSLFRLAFFRYFVFSLGVISSWRRAITPGEKTKERNNEMAQTSHHNRGLNHLELYCTLTIEAWLKLNIHFDRGYLELYNACIISLVFNCTESYLEIEMNLNIIPLFF